MFFLHLREPRSGEEESKSGEKEKPLVTLDFNLTFMHTPTVKGVEFIITKWTNGKLAITQYFKEGLTREIARIQIYFYSGGEECYHVFEHLIESRQST